MPWNPKTLAAICAGLRQSAQDGNFVPCAWNAGLVTGDHNGYHFYGCGWGLVGWFAAVFVGGADWAKCMLPIGCDQKDVNRVLRCAGLTQAEIARMTPAFVWARFDQELISAYCNRHLDWQAYIQKSMQLAEGFIAVLERVPVEEEKIIEFTSTRRRPAPLRLHGDLMVSAGVNQPHITEAV